MPTIWDKLNRDADYKYGRDHSHAKVLVALEEEEDWNGVCSFCGEDVGEVYNHVQEEVYCSKCANFFTRGNHENL